MKLQRIAAMTKKNLKRLVREPSSLFMLLLFPMILTAAFAFAFGGIGTSGQQNFTIGVVNSDTTSVHPEWAARFIGNLTHTEGITVANYTDNATGQAELLQGNLDAFIVIPVGFGSSCQSYWSSPYNGSSWTNTTIGLYVDSGSLIATSAIPSLVRQVLLTTIFGTKALSLDIPVQVGSPALVAASTLSSWDFLAPGVFAFASMWILMIVAQSLSADRNGGLLKRLATTPLSSSEYMLSEVAYNMIVAVLQVSIVFGVAYLIGYRPATDAVGLAFAFSIVILFSLDSVGFGLITATVSKSPDVATGLSFIFIMPQMFLGTFIPLRGAAQTAAAFMPSSYVTNALTTLFLRGAPVTTLSLWIDLFVVGAVGVVVVLLGIVLFGKLGRK